MSDLTEKMTVIRETRETYERLRIAEKRIAELEAILEPLQNSVDKAESLGRKVQDEVDMSKQNSNLTAENAELRRLLAMALEAMKQIVDRN